MTARVAPQGKVDPWQQLQNPYGRKVQSAQCIIDHGRKKNRKLGKDNQSQGRSAEGKPEYPGRGKLCSNDGRHGLQKV